LRTAVLLSIAQGSTEKNDTVVCSAVCEGKNDLFKREEIPVQTEIVVYRVDGGEGIEVRRPLERSCTGTIGQAMPAYAHGEAGPLAVPVSQAERLIANGPDSSPMQPMTNAVYAQCLQPHVDPLTGGEGSVFTCSTMTS
jgi:hypothetical protein